MKVDLKDGDLVNQLFLVSNITIKEKKNGEPYLDLKLTDNDGIYDGKLWSVPVGTEDFLSRVARIRGRIREYNGCLQVTVDKMVLTDEDPLDLCPRSSIDADAVWDDLVVVLKSIENPDCKKLLDAFITSESFVKQFKVASAAVSVHHASVGGLLEHTSSVVFLCDDFSKRYSFLNRDLLLTAAFCHDLGKLKEISRFPENSMTDYGNYVGHVVGSTLMISSVCGQIPNFSSEVLMKLEHCILAHHGQLEFGSPKVPALPEAMVLHLADNLDSKMKIFEGEMQKPDWQGFNRYLGTKVASGAFHYEN